MRTQASKLFWAAVATVATAMVIAPTPADAQTQAPQTPRADAPGAETPLAETPAAEVRHRNGPGERARASVTEAARFLPDVLLAVTGEPIVTTLGWGGYDMASQAPMAGISLEGRMTSFLVIGVGAAYVAGDQEEGTSAGARPRVYARAQILNQAQHHLDLGVDLGFRQDSFYAEKGAFEGGVAVGLHDEVSSLLVRLGYAIDGEGDDHQGELRVVGMRRLVGDLFAGIDGKAHVLLPWTSDPRRAVEGLSATGAPTLRFAIGPALTWAVGPLRLMVQAGWSGLFDSERSADGVIKSELRSGAFVVGGLGASL